MEDWQLRVLEEQTELLSKLVKLKAFLASGYSNSIGREERDLLVVQAAHMQAYSDVLSRRISSFEIQTKTA